jgi:hypothetical protein
MLLQPWSGRLTARERFSRQLRGLSVDRSVNMEFGYWDDNFKLWPMFRDNGIRSNPEADRFLGFDPVDCVWLHAGIHPAFPEEEISRTATTRILRNGDGLLAEVPLDGHDTIPHYLESSIKGPEDWDRVKKERFDRAHPSRRLDVASLKVRHPESRTYPLGVWAGSMIGKIRDMLTVEQLAYFIYDYPEMVEDMVETACVLVEDGLDQVLPHFRFDFAAGWEDICYKSGPLVGVPFFRDVVVPRYKRISQKLRAAGVDLFYTDCDGDVRPLIPHFLEGGINVMFPWEVNGSGPVGPVLEQYGDQLAIMGGVDKMRLREGPEAIRRMLEDLAPWVEKGRYIPHCDHRCPPDVSQENYLYYLDLKQRMFSGKDLEVRS